jgi:hypothetical protein
MNWEEPWDHDEAEMKIESDSIDLSRYHILRRPLMMSMDRNFVWLRCHLSSILFLLPTDLVLEWRPVPGHSAVGSVARVLQDTDTPRTVGMRNWTYSLETIFCINRSHIFNCRPN